MYDTIAAHIGRVTGRRITFDRHRFVGGGCINRAVLLEGDGGVIFVKLNGRDLKPMFEAEAEGLQAIGATSTLRTPRPICCGEGDEYAYLVLEYIDLGRGAPAAMAALGTGLAALHCTTSACFGWHRDNTIGLTPQINAYARDWVKFLGEHRLGYQIRLAAVHGMPVSTLTAAERLLDRLETFFDGYAPSPSLLHGDLWGGNVGADETGTPVIFDPAVYFGDHEADLALTELFGGFDQSFYDAYNAAWALDPGYRVRKHLYKLYHVLNHFNLFGGAYAAQARSMIHELLAESG